MGEPDAHLTICSGVHNVHHELVYPLQASVFLAIIEVIIIWTSR